MLKYRGNAGVEPPCIALAPDEFDAGMPCAGELPGYLVRPLRVTSCSLFVSLLAAKSGRCTRRAPAGDRWAGRWHAGQPSSSRAHVPSSDATRWSMPLPLPTLGLAKHLSWVG